MKRFARSARSPRSARSRPGRGARPAAGAAAAGGRASGDAAAVRHDRHRPLSLLRGPQAARRAAVLPRSRTPTRAPCWIGSIPARTRMLARIKQLDNAGVTRRRTAARRRLVLLRKAEARREPAQDLRPARLGRAGTRADRSGRLTADTNKHFTVDYFAPSFDGAYVAYGISEGGSEESVLHVIETATGRVLPDAITRARDGVSGWRTDNTSFYYLRENKLAPGEPATDKEQKVRTYLHVLGQIRKPTSPSPGSASRRRAGRADRIRSGRDDPRIELRAGDRAERRAERSDGLRGPGRDRDERAGTVAERSSTSRTT